MPPEVSTRLLPSRSPRTPEQIQSRFLKAERSLSFTSENIPPALTALFDNDVSPVAPRQTPDCLPGNYFNPMIIEARRDVKTTKVPKRQSEEPVGEGRQDHAAGSLSCPGTAARRRTSSSTTTPRSGRRNSPLAQTMHDSIRSAPNSPRGIGGLAIGTGRGKRISHSSEALPTIKRDVGRNDSPGIKSPQIELPEIESLQIETPPKETPPGNTPPIDMRQQDPFSIEVNPYGKPKFTRYNGEERRLDSINMNIHKQLLAESSPKKPGGKVAGWVYIYESPSHAEGYIKVGQTKNDTARRVKSWQRCRIPIQEVEDTDRDAFDHFGLVEKLIMEEFNNERMQYTCITCKSKKHNEWYKIDKKRVIKCKNRWRRWLKTHEPYDSRGVLTPYWQWKVMNIKKQASRVDWDVWTNPWWFDGILYKCGALEKVVDHWGRHDGHFWVVGMFGLLVLYIRFRSWEPALWWVTALLVL